MVPAYHLDRLVDRITSVESRTGTIEQNVSAIQAQIGMGNDQSKAKSSSSGPPELQKPVSGGIDRKYTSNASNQAANASKIPKPASSKLNEAPAPAPASSKATTQAARKVVMPKR